MKYLLIAVSGATILILGGAVISTIGPPRRAIPSASPPSAITYTHNDTLGLTCAVTPRGGIACLWDSDRPAR